MLLPVGLADVGMTPQGNKLLAPLVANMMNTRPTTTQNDSRRDASQRVSDFSHPDKVPSRHQPLRPGVRRTERQIHRFAETARHVHVSASPGCSGGRYCHAPAALCIRASP